MSKTRKTQACPPASTLGLSLTFDEVKAAYYAGDMPTVGRYLNLRKPFVTAQLISTLLSECDKNMDNATTIVRKIFDATISES